MRSVFVYLRNANEEEVGNFLREQCSANGPAWVVKVDGDACLYIDFYTDGPSEMGPDEWAALEASLGGNPSICLIVDVSGRHRGDKEVLEFLNGVLTRFEGAVRDEYTDHSWSLKEITSGLRVEGHPFFDYRGWYEANRNEP